MKFFAVRGVATFVRQSCKELHIIGAIRIFARISSHVQDRKHFILDSSDPRRSLALEFAFEQASHTVTRFPRTHVIDTTRHYSTLVLC